MCRDEVMMEAEKLSGSPPGSRAFLGSLQNATTKLWNSLPDDERQVYVNLADKWSEEPPPANIQARYVHSMHSYGPNTQIFTEWQALSACELSVTFRDSYLDLVVSAVSFLLHTNRKIIQLLLACTFSEIQFPCRLHSILYVSIAQV